MKSDVRRDQSWSQEDTVPRYLLLKGRPFYLLFLKAVLTIISFLLVREESLQLSTPRNPGVLHPNRFLQCSMVYFFVYFVEVRNCPHRWSSSRASSCSPSIWLHVPQ